MQTHIIRRLNRSLCGTLALGLATAVGCLAAPAAHASNAAPCYGPGTFPVAGGIPPWGYHTGPSLASNAQSGSYARAQGNIDLAARTISGEICQVDVHHGRQDQIIMHAISPILFHTHEAQMWGYPGNEIRTRVRVSASDDPSCRVGTIGTMTMYASYNNVRSDSVQYTFRRGCTSHDHLYHGSQVDAQVPPL